MKAHCLLAAILISFVGLCWADPVDAQDGQPIENGNGDTWQVEYGDDGGALMNGGRGYRAARLLVSSATSDATDNPAKVTAILYRFGAPQDGTYPLLTIGGRVELSGHVSKAAKITNGNKVYYKKSVLEFALVGHYHDEKNIIHVVKVRGNFSPGKRNRANNKGRSDDRVTFTVTDKPLDKSAASLALQLQLEALLPGEENDTKRKMVAASVWTIIGGSGVPCDDAPPMDAAEEVSAIPEGQSNPVYETFVYVSEEDASE